ncbi:MAG: hypothetical protein RI973_263 [Bacteroidota bacterium]|jgi:hypothetical protein
MSKLRLLAALFLLSGFIPRAMGGIEVGLRQFASNGNPHHLLISYKAKSNYLSAGAGIWNSQVLTLRWPASQGLNAVGAITGLGAFSFEKDGGAAAGGDGYYYQKFTAPETNVDLALENGEMLDVLLIQLNFSGLSGWTFELVTASNAWAQQNQGKANVENASLGEQFSAFNPAVASYFQLPGDIRFVRAPAALDHMDLVVNTSNGWPQEAQPAVYPNPVTAGLVMLSWPYEADRSVLVTLHTVDGIKVLVRQFDLLPGDQRLLLELTALPAGIYVLNAYGRHASFSEKIVLQK